jgi:hypothetical protein
VKTRCGFYFRIVERIPARSSLGHAWWVGSQDKTNCEKYDGLAEGSQCALSSRPDRLPPSFDLLRFEIDSLALPLPRLAPACCFGVCVSCAPTDCHAVVVVESPIARIDAAVAIVVSPRRRIIMVSVIGFA